MGEPGTFVIIGGGQAGGKAAETLRGEGFEGDVVLLAAEPEVPYQRPPLSKGYLQGSESRESAMLKEPAWYEENRIDLRLATVATQFDRETRRVVLANGAQLGYDGLLLATGSSARRLDLPGADLPGVRVLRTLADSDSLKAAIAAASRVAIVGGGWIGLEVASAARVAGRPVTVIEQADLPLVGVLGAEMAAVFAGLHEEHGVDLISGAGVGGFEESKGSVSGVSLTDGRTIPADLVVVGIGARPNTDLAEAAGLEMKGGGVVVDASLRTDDPAVFAAGDIAAAFHPVLGRHIRIEHWDNAVGQGEAAARSMLGQEVSYERLPFFFTDQYDLGMEYVGSIPESGYDQVVTRGDVAGRRFLAFWLGQGQILAGMHVNVWDTVDQLRALVGRRDVDLDRLRDTDVTLADL